jgi:hypothetical protein
MSNLIEKDVLDILIPAFWAVVMITLMEWECTDWVIKIRDEAIEKILSLPLQQWGNEKIKEVIEKKIVRYQSLAEQWSWYKYDALDRALFVSGVAIKLLLSKDRVRGSINVFARA